MFSSSTIKTTMIAALLGAATTDAAGHTKHCDGTYKVSVDNLTFRQPFSPVVAVAHNKGFKIFEPMVPASGPLQIVAEDGNPSALVELLGKNDLVCGYTVGEGPLFPGETWDGMLTVPEDCDCDTLAFSVVTMLINTNDAFMGVSAMQFGSEGLSTIAPAWDAGTEANTEMCSDMPGPACPSDSGNVSGGTGEGFVHISRGFHGVGSLVEQRYDWRNPVSTINVEMYNS